MGSLSIERKVGTSFYIFDEKGRKITVELKSIRSGNKARINILAGDEFTILRDDAKKKSIN